MKNANYKTPYSYQIALFTAIFVIVGFANVYAKNSPTIPKERQIAFNRARKLDNGISISWLEQTWNNNVFQSDGVKETDLQLLRKLGFKTLRLPVAFAHFNRNAIPFSQVTDRIDRVWKLCRANSINLIIDYHYGVLNNENHFSATQDIINTWTKLAEKYRGEEYESLYFEIYNEPPPINPQVWKDAAYNIVNAIHKVDARRTLLVGASNYNSIYELSRFIRLKDENVIYTFHFYEPFFFTHQGASWVGKQVATIGVPFPYNAEKFPQLNAQARGTAGEDNYKKYHIDGNERSVHDKLQIVKNWSTKYVVPVLCSEYGAFNKYADLDSRCRYIKTVRKELKSLRISGIIWDYNTNFSIFNGDPSLATLPACMCDAIGYTNK